MSCVCKKCGQPCDCDELYCERCLIDAEEKEEERILEEDSD